MQILLAALILSVLQSTPAGQIAAALRDDPELRAASIEVREHNGAFFLTGSVSSVALKRRVGDIVVKIAPGRRVLNQLLVR